MFQLNTFRFWLFSKEKIILFTKHMRIQSRSYNKNKRSFSINSLAPHSSRIRKILFKFEFVHLESEFFYFFCLNRYYSIPIPSRYLSRKISNWILNWRVSVSLSMRLCTLRIGIHFLKDPGFRALVGLRDPFDDLCCYVVLKGYLYDPIDCVKPAVAREPGKVYRKDSSFLLY